MQPFRRRTPLFWYLVELWMFDKLGDVRGERNGGMACLASVLQTMADTLFRHQVKTP